MKQYKLDFVNWDKVRLGHLQATINKLESENNKLRLSKRSYKGWKTRRDK